MNRAARRRVQKARRNEPTVTVPPAPRVCVATLYATQAPPAGAFFDAWSNLLTARPVDIAEVVTVSGSLVTDARNIIARRFLASDAEWLFTVDSDMDFPLDTPRALIAHADPVDRPIVGALCFKVHRDGTTEPTMYRLVAEPQTHLRVVDDWQRGALVQVDATGAACLLVHRSVFEKLPEPWFEPAELAGETLGEDVTFCLSARQAGFPIHVASSVDVGHVKPYSFGVADWERDRSEVVWTYVVIPVRNAGDPIPITECGPGIRGVIAIPNNEGEVTNTPAKWTEGMAWAEQEARAEGFSKWNVLLVNDDVVMDAADVVGKLSRALRADPSHALAYPNTNNIAGEHGWVTTTTNDPGGLTHSGYCFMLRGESALPFDTRLAWHYADNDYEKAINARGRKVVSVLDCHIEHLHPNESTLASPELIAQAVKDEALFAEKWGVDPSGLFWAQHPELVDGARHVG